MFLKAIVALALLAVVLSMSGCCGCLQFLTGGADNSQTDNTPTDPGDASMLIGGEWETSSHLTYEDSNDGSYAGDEGVSQSIQFFDNGTFVSVGASYGSSQIGYYMSGHYHVTGDTIKFTNVVDNEYPNIAQTQHTTRNIAETTGTLTLDTTSDDAYDLLTIQVPDMWAGSKLSLSRYKTG